MTVLLEYINALASLVGDWVDWLVNHYKMAAILASLVTVTSSTCAIGIQLKLKTHANMQLTISDGKS